VEQVVFNAKEPLAGSNRSAYLAVLSEHAEELARAGDSSLAQKLVTLPAFRNIQRESGQALQSLGMIGRQSVIKTVNNLKTKLEESLPSFAKMNKTTEINNFKKEIKQVLDSVAKKKMTKKELSDIVDSLVCK